MAALVLPALAQAQWVPQLEASLLHDSNFSRAQRKEDVASDFALHLRGTLDRAFAVADRGELTLTLDAKAQQNAHFERASYASLGAAGAYRHKLGLGLTAPWLAASAFLAQEDARTAVRDVRRAGAALLLDKRFQERLAASLGAAYDRSVQLEDLPVVAGISGKAFSLQGRTLFARGSYALDEGITILGGASLRRGDVESTTRRNLQIFRASNAIALDPAIGPDFVAYRLSGARTRSFTAGLSRELDRRSSISATLTADDTRAPAGLNYRGVVVALIYAYRR